MEQWLGDYCNNVNEDLGYTSRKSILAQFDSYKNLIVIVGNLLCLVLAFIGILNFINTMVTSVLSRKQEFAMMEAVALCLPVLLLVVYVVPVVCYRRMCRTSVVERMGKMD